MTIHVRQFNNSGLPPHGVPPATNQNWEDAAARLLEQLGFTPIRN